MNVQPADIRNISFVGHPLSGKTTLVDLLAHLTGASDRKGSVADRTSVCDTEPEEQEKGHTLQAKVVHARWHGRVWNLLDTPGYPDFVMEADAAMWASDLVVGVVSAASGVTFQLRKRMQEALDVHRGRALVITHLDAENVDFASLVERLQERIGEQCVPMQTPNASGPAFKSIEEVLDHPEGPWRSILMDRVMDACEDEALLSRYLETGELSQAELDLWLPIAIEKGSVVPILLCNPDSGLGGAALLHFFDEFGPSPATRSGFLADGVHIDPDPTAPLLACAFCVRADAHVGKVVMARVLRGTLHASDLIAPAGAHEKGEKIGGLYHLVGGRKREPATLAVAGEIVALTKVDQVHFGKAFALAGKPVPQVEFPATLLPMTALAVVPKARADEQKIGDALHRLLAEEPTLRMEHDAGTGELVLYGTSELHLSIVQARLKRRFGVEISTHLPKIAYRESITKPADASYRHKKQSGGRGQFGECHLRLRPGAKDAGVVFIDKVVGGSIPRNLIPAVEKGVREICARGVLTHAQVVDVEAEVYDGKYHDVDSDEASFKIAGARAFREAFAKAGPVLLEPVVELEVHCPTEHAGHVFSDLTSHRRGHVLDQQVEQDGHVTVIRAQAPLALVQTYQRDLKSQTAGEGFFSSRIVHYAPVPPAEQVQILAKYSRTHDDD